MKFCKPCTTHIQKGEKFSKSQCPKDDDETAKMEKIPYASAVGSLMYAQVCTRVEHIPIELMIADPLTKGLTIKVFVEHVTCMGVVRSF